MSRLEVIVAVWHCQIKNSIVQVSPSVFVIKINTISLFSVGFEVTLWLSATESEARENRFVVRMTGVSSGKDSSASHGLQRKECLELAVEKEKNRLMIRAMFITVSCMYFQFEPRCKQTGMCSVQLSMIIIDIEFGQNWLFTKNTLYYTTKVIKQMGKSAQDNQIYDQNR